MAHPAPRFLDRHSPPHMGTLIAMAALPALTMNIILPSLPRMAEAYGVSYPVMQLAVSLFLITNAVVQVLIGPVADRYGRRPVVLGALAVFILGSIGTLAAPSAQVFLMMRMLQAVAAAGMVMARAVVRDTHPIDRAASMIGYVTMGMSLAPMMAPTLGGFLEEAFGWRGSLWFLLGAGVLVMALVWLDQGETAARTPTSLAAQLRQYPDLLRSRRFWSYTMVATLGSGSFYAYLGGAPYVASEVYGLTSLQLGLGFAVPSVGYALGNFVAGRWSARVGLHRMILWGAMAVTISMAGLGLAILAGLSGPVVFFGAMAGVGLGNGMLLPNANAGILSVSPTLAGSASGLGGAITLAGGAVFAIAAGLVLHPGVAGGGAGPLVLIMLIASLGTLGVWGVLVAQARRPGF